MNYNDKTYRSGIKEETIQNKEYKVYMKKHNGNSCLEGKGFYFKCGQPDNLSYNCPNPRGKYNYKCGKEGHFCRGCTKKKEEASENKENKSPSVRGSTTGRHLARVFNMTVIDVIEGHPFSGRTI